LSTHIEDVVNTILYEDLHDIILVGHSYGGMVITGVADRVPDRIKRLVYLDAFIPGDGESVMSIIGARSEFLKPMIKGDYIVPPWVKPDQAPPKDVPQSLKTFSEPLALKNKAARALPEEVWSSDPSTALTRIAHALRRAVGGTSGPFYAAALIRAARAVPEKPTARQLDLLSVVIECIGDNALAKGV